MSDATTAAKAIQAQTRRLGPIWDDEPVYRDAGVVLARLNEAITHLEAQTMNLSFLLQAARVDPILRDAVLQVERDQVAALACLRGEV